MKYKLFFNYDRIGYRKISNNWPKCYVVGVASSGKVWCFFCFFMSLRGAEQRLFCRDFRPFSKVGNSRRHSTWANFSRFYGMVFTVYQFGKGVKFLLLFGFIGHNSGSMLWIFLYLATNEPKILNKKKKRKKESEHVLKTGGVLASAGFGWASAGFVWACVGLGWHLPALAVPTGVTPEVQGISFVGCTGGEGSKPRLWNLQNLCPVPP